MKSIVRILAMLALLAAFVGCDQLAEQVTVTLNKGLISNLPVGSQQTLKATVTPEEFSASVVWSSDNEEVAVVSKEGVVTGVAPGEAVITAKVGESSATCKVVVTAVKPTSIALNMPELDLEVADTYQLEYTVGPEFATADDVQWESSNNAVATVENGLVTAVSVGEAVITVKCNDNSLAATCQVRVLGEIEEVSVTAIELANPEMALSVGGEMSLVWTVVPANATNKNVEFSVEGDCISIDEKGNVVGLEPGQAVVTISATDGSGVKAECNVTVTQDVSVKAVIVKTPNGTDLQVGETLQLAVSFVPENATPVSVSWTMSDDDYEYAQVDQNGLMTGLYTESFLSDPNNDMSPKAWKQVVVTVTADGVSGNTTIRVIPKQPKYIELDLPENNTIRINEEWSFNPRVIPEELGFQAYCSSSLPGGHVDNDAYTPFSSEIPGTMNITFAVRGTDDLVSEYTPANRHISISVIPYWVETMSIPESYEIETGSSVILPATFTSDAEGVQPTYKDLKWSSSNPEVASVDEKTGEILAHTAGTVEITAVTSHDWSVPGGTSPKTATCVMTVKAANVPLNVGDFYYSDGTWSSELNTSKTVIGVVFSRTNAASADHLLAKDYPECSHGLVVSTMEYTSPCVTGRGWSRSALLDWMSANGYDQMLENNDKYCGYNNTEGLIALNEAQIVSYDDVVSVDYVNKVVEHREAVQVPAKASKWYMPSFLEMQAMSENIDAINAALAQVDGQLLYKTYEYVYNRPTTAGPVPTTATANKQYYYCNNFTSSYIYAFDMQDCKAVNPKLYTDSSDATSSGESTELPIRMVLAF